MEIYRPIRFFLLGKYTLWNNNCKICRRLLAPVSNKKYVKPKWFGFSALLGASVIQSNSTLDGKENFRDELFDYSHRKLIQQACSSSVNSTSELLTQILLAVIDSATKYKNCLNDLMSNLQKADELLGYGTINPKNEDNIIEIRIQAKKLKEEFLDLVTMMEHIEKLATAAAEVSFLIGAETLAMLISERLYSIQEKIKNEIEDVRKLENEYLEVQKSSIEEN